MTFAAYLWVCWGQACLAFREPGFGSHQSCTEWIELFRLELDPLARISHAICQKEHPHDRS